MQPKFAEAVEFKKYLCFGWYPEKISIAGGIMNDNSFSLLLESLKTEIGDNILFYIRK